MIKNVRTQTVKHLCKFEPVTCFLKKCIFHHSLNKVRQTMRGETWAHFIRQRRLYFLNFAESFRNKFNNFFSSLSYVVNFCSKIKSFLSPNSPIVQSKKDQKLLFIYLLAVRKHVNISQQEFLAFP